VKFFWLPNLLLIISIFSSACRNSVPSLAKSETTDNAVIQGRPQPKLPTIKVWLGPHELTAEVAHTMDQLTNGMMFRSNMDEQEAMLFVFPEPYQVAFWMKNTLIPLSCAYIDGDGIILEIHDMKPKDETQIRAASDRIQFVLETRQGWFERNNISVGTAVRTERGGLRETFYGRQ